MERAIPSPLVGVHTTMLPTSTFISRSNEIHKNRYNYSLVICINSRIKVKIICPVHGVFEQSCYSHLAGRGCPFCGLSKIGNKKRATLEQFVLRANTIHVNKYDYSLVVYNNNLTKIKILCPIHGIFEQTPSSHLSGHGCAKCAFESLSNRYRKSTNEFICKANEVHNNKYDYSFSIYKDRHALMKIRCPVHGVFEQTPGKHLSGQGCYTCGKNSMGLKRRSNTDSFIKRALKVHGGKYDYSLVDYTIDSKNVKIICPKHGIFEQTPNNHIKGNGCNICNESKGERYLSNLLENKEIIFERQKRFKGCKNKRELPFDFFIPAIDTCIEYDGIFHYKSVFGGRYIKSFKDTLHNDAIKTTFCIHNGIDLIRIPYTTEKSEIDNIVNNLKLRIGGTV